jgi:hypothetical protein
MLYKQAIIAIQANRKKVKMTASGGQQAELHLDILAHAQHGFQDLRLMRAGRQVPYLLNLTSLSRVIAPVVSVAADSRNPHLSRWSLRLPESSLPVTRLTCVSPTALFQRDMALNEDAANGRGQTYRQVLGHASWVQTPNRGAREFVMTLDESPQAGTVTLETSNGDNPPIELQNFQLFYPVTAVVFNGNANDETFLYYGNPAATSPHYDLSLVADQLMAADRSPAVLQEQEQLRKSS